MHGRESESVSLMRGEVEHGGSRYAFDFGAPVDLALPLRAGKERNPNCYWAEGPRFETIRAEGFVGSVAEGGAVNHRTAIFAPHGVGTHTETYAHLSEGGPSVGASWGRYAFFCALVSVAPETRPDGEAVVSREAVAGRLSALGLAVPEALVLRTWPNGPDKRRRQYSGTNPPYLEAGLCAWLAEGGTLHLLVDLPSLDREVDGGALAAHRAFFGLPDAPRASATVTELVYAPDSAPDGAYLLHLQAAAFESDAAPSRPTLYALRKLS